jgi:drug/metabolite transporter (DMT)-like permease
MPQLALLLSTIIWGATFPATKIALDQVPPFTFLCLRFLLGAGLVVATLLVFRIRLRLTRDLLRMSAVATVFLFIGYAAQTLGLRSTTASNSAFLTSLYVIFVPLFLLRFDGRTWLAVGLAVVGLWFLVNPTVAPNEGDLWTLGCAAGFALHIICLERYTRRSDPSLLLLWQMLLVLAPIAPAMWLEHPGGEVFRLSLPLVVSLAVTGGLATLAFGAQVWAQQFVPAQRVALIFSLEPAYAAWLSWYYLGEQLGPSGWIGSALILTAVLLTTVRPLPKPAPPAVAAAPEA